MKGHLKRNRMTQISASKHLPLWSNRTTKNDLDFGQTPYYSPWFLAKNGKFSLRPKRILYERASQEEQNDANFSFIAPTTVE